MNAKQNNHEYVPLKEFARRMGITIRTAREWAHSKRFEKYIRRLNTKQSAIFLNWTLFQKDFENGIV